MLLVKAELRPSSIHGLGVFAAEFIAAGTVVWRFQPNFDFRVSEESVAALPEIARAKLLHYSAKWGGGYVISADDSRFINHSATDANLRTMADPDMDIATRDIQPGEELLEDYREFDDTFGGRPIERRIDAAIGEPAASREDDLSRPLFAETVETLVARGTPEARRELRLRGFPGEPAASQDIDAATGTADDQIDPAVVDEIRKRISRTGLTTEQFIATFDALTPEQIRAALAPTRGHGWVTGTADIDAMDDTAARDEMEPR